MSRKKIKEPKKNGRPTKFTLELGDEICARISNGESLSKICKDEHIPSMVTVFAWMRTQEGFLNSYTRAREEQAETLADEIIQIADDGKNDKYKDEDGFEQTNHDVIARSRLRVEARKWVAAKLKPKKFGDLVNLKAEVKDTSKTAGWLLDTLNAIDKNKNE